MSHGIYLYITLWDTFPGRLTRHHQSARAFNYSNFERNLQYDIVCYDILFIDIKYLFWKCLFWKIYFEILKISNGLENNVKDTLQRWFLLKFNPGSNKANPLLDKLYLMN